MSEKTSVRTTCPYCGVGCGVLAEVEADGSVRVQGDPEHPANYGRLCSKGSALGETVALEGRLLYPEIGGERVSWPEALDHLADRFTSIIRRDGPEAVAFYVSGQLLTEDYYVANKLMKGFIGSANLDTNSRLCMSSSVAGYKRAFGEDCVPGCYEDLELADLWVLVGSNTAWCHPVLFQRITKAKAENPRRKVVSIDPRRTATNELVDLHLPIQPGTDVMLFNGLLNFLRRQDKLDFSYLEQHVQGFAAALAAAENASIPEVAGTCGVNEEDVSTFYQWFARTEKVITAWSQGVNQSSSGTDKVNSIINVHLASGRIGRPGMGPFSLTGQPNAMGGREVGGLANQLAAHMELEIPEHREKVAEFWQAPNLASRPGLKAVDMFRAIGEGKIKAVWVMATNPVVSLPDAEGVRQALERCELIVVSDCEDRTDLKPFAHVRLPAAAWGEKDGTVTNSERCISRQRPFLPLPEEARPDWWIVTEVARRMGFAEAFPYRSPAEIFQEHARLSGFRNDGRRVFDISALGGLDTTGYDALQPIQWPVNRDAPYGTARLFTQAGYPGGRARMLPLTPRPPENAPDEEYPFILNTGRIRDQWHTMTRTAKSPRLNQHLTEPYAELHARDAARYGIEDGALVRLRSRYGSALARARVGTDQRPGSVFMPMHWSGPFAKRALANALVNPVTDPVSGEPESKHTPVCIAPFRPAWHGFLLSRRPQEIDNADYCVTVRGDGYWLYELAGDMTPES
jgi:assimilatory nitrate reductase catalytic subunit